MKGYATQLIPDGQLDKVLKPVISIKRNAQGKITQGLVIGSTQAQNEALILSSNPGEYKNSPRLGVGLENALLGNTSELLAYRHHVRSSYAIEGLEIKELDLFSWKKMNIKAVYP